MEREKTETYSTYQKKNERNIKEIKTRKELRLTYILPCQVFSVFMININKNVPEMQKKAKNKTPKKK